MRKIVMLSFLLLFMISCSSSKKTVDSFNYSKIEIDTLLNQKMSSRALLVDGNKVWFGATGNKFGFVNLTTKEHKIIEVGNVDLKIDFRSIAQTPNAVFVASVANPGLIYKIDKDLGKIELVYEEKHEKVFYDSMLFMNDNEGIVIGDPTENCPSIVITNNGGDTWRKLSCSNLPNFDEGEAFFAASNTNIMYRNNTLIMVSGGKKSRVYTSKDKGKTWQTFETPIVQGSAMTGAFTADFYNERIGIIAGGDYEKPQQNNTNKAITKDGGKTWQLMAENQGFGYASCIQFVPKSKGKCLLEMGANGIFYSNDSAKSWTQLAPDKDFIAFRFVDEKTVVASGKNRIVSIHLK
ncbi:oxidoreductase [Flavobacterium amnicola]|uniref:Oxidoreductase n=1 Tax=Flavobacterium amnicola TaxID=2506422 RepID=A0A4Q1K2U1_9FLAO|nr:oxidoreductase [Flavobacterium amnicola]RXR19047.1 oxidoreductase [Flavobacterium amnicola]